MTRHHTFGAVLPLLALLGACGESGEVYAKPAKDVRLMLQGIDVPTALANVSFADARTIDNGDGSVTWVVSQDGNRVLRFMGRTEEVDAASTRLVLEMLPVNDSASDPAELAALRDAYFAAMAEQIDAKLEGRSIDSEKINAAIMIAMSSQMKAAFAEVSDQLDEIESFNEPAFGEPMDDASGGY